MKLAASIAALVWLSLPSTAFAQQPDPRPGPSTPVTVMNTPLPVTGTLEITSANPLPVVAVQPDDTVLNAFQKRISFGAGNPDSDKEFLVPAGTRLVIESITTEADVAVNQRPQVFLSLSLGGKNSIHYVPVTFAGRDDGGSFPTDTFQASHQTRWFADGGTMVRVVCRHLAFTAVNTCGLDMSISGFLVTMP